MQPNQSEEDMARQGKGQLGEENDQLRQRIRQLEKALEYSRMETRARDVMIELAEKRFEIPIRKKSGAKQ